MQAHETEIVVMINAADMSIAEIFTNDRELARQLELQGCRRDNTLFEDGSLRDVVASRLAHLFVVASRQIILSALRPVFQGYEQISWRRVSDRTVQAKLAEVRREKQRQELAERAAYERTRAAKMTQEHKDQLAAQRSERQRQWSEQQKQAQAARSRRYMASRSEEKKAQQRERKRLNEIARRARRAQS